MKKKILFTLALTVLACAFCISAFAEDTVPENYVESDSTYTVYTEGQLKEVFDGLVDGTLANKVIEFGCDIAMPNYDLYLDAPCDITIDLKGFTYSNTKRVGQTGDFQFSNYDAILRIKNGNIYSTFCAFIFANQGQLYAENINVDSGDECIYSYGNHKAVVSLKNCTMDARGNFRAVCLGNCGSQSDNGTLYQIEGGKYGGLGIYCAVEGSYIKDCTVTGMTMFLETWHRHGEGGTVLTLPITNVRVDENIELNDPALAPVLYDCTFAGINMFNKTTAEIVSYTSADCLLPGTKTVYHGSATGVVDEQYALDNPALGHAIDLESPTDLKYASYLEKGYYTGDCARCGEKDVKEATPSARALFACKGVSICEYGRLGILMDFEIDIDAIENYERITGNTIEFGVAVASADNLGDNTMLDENGKATVLETGKIISAPVKKANEYMILKVSGFSEEQKSLSLVMCGYVITTDAQGGKAIEYMQEKQAEEGKLYSYVSYNSVAGIE